MKQLKKVVIFYLCAIIGTNIYIFVLKKKSPWKVCVIKPLSVCFHLHLFSRRRTFVLSLRLCLFPSVCPWISAKCPLCFSTNWFRAQSEIRRTEPGPRDGADAYQRACVRVQVCVRAREGRPAVAVAPPLIVRTSLWSLKLLTHFSALVS